MWVLPPTRKAPTKEMMPGRAARGKAAATVAVWARVDLTAIAPTVVPRVANSGRVRVGRLV